MIQPYADIYYIQYIQSQIQILLIEIRQMHYNFVFLYSLVLLLCYSITVNACLFQVLIATSTLAWGVNFPAHLVVIKGTEYYDGKSRRYIDYPITGIQCFSLLCSHFHLSPFHFVDKGLGNCIINALNYGAYRPCCLLDECKQ